MYGFIWRKLPGGPTIKTGLAVVLIAAVAALLWYVVFPWAEPYIGLDQV